MTEIDPVATQIVAAALQALGQDEGTGLDALTAAVAGSAWSGRQFGAVRNIGRWWVVVLDGPTDVLDEETSVDLIGDAAEVFSGRWDTVRLNDNLQLGRDAAFAGELWSHWFEEEMLPPFHLDPDAWAGSVDNGFPASNHQRFEVTVDASPSRFDPYELNLWGPEPAKIRAGTWLSLEHYYGGAFVSADEHGGLWGSMPEFGVVFLGRPTSEDPSPADAIESVLATLYGGGQMDFDSMESDLLDAQQMSRHIATLRALGPNFDPDDIYVNCVGFNGTVTELLLSLGITERGPVVSNLDGP